MSINDVSTYSEAIDFIQQNPGLTEIELRQIVSQMPVSVSGSVTTLLYSGTFDPNGQNIKAWQIAELLGEQSNGTIATIGQTDAARLLSNADFRQSLIDAVGAPQATIVLDGVTDTLTGNRITPGLWDNISQSFVENATGTVKTISPTAEFNGVFTQTELLALLENENITTIDGLPRQHFVDMHENALLDGDSSSEALRKVQASVNSESLVHTIELNIITDGSGNVTAVGANHGFWGDTPSVQYTSISDAMPGHVSVSELLGELTPAQWDHLVDGGKRLLIQAGIVGDALALLIIANDAQAAVNEGDYAGAAKIIAEYVGGFVGGAVVGLGIAAVAAPALAAVGVTGTLGAVLVGTAAFLGGIGGDIAGQASVRGLIEHAEKLGLITDEIISDFSDAIDNPEEYFSGLSEDMREGIASLLSPLGNEFLEEAGLNSPMQVISQDDLETELDIPNIDVARVLPGNEWMQDNSIFLANGERLLSLYHNNPIYLPEINDVPAYSLGVGIYFPSTGQYSYGVSYFDSQNNLITANPNNLYLNSGTNFNNGSHYSGLPDEGSWLDGIGLDGGNYQSTMPSSILNGNGLWNVLPSGMLTDSLRPGSGSIGTDQGFLSFFNDIIESFFSFSPSGGAFPSLNIVYDAMISTLTGLQYGSPALLNTDPLVLDLDGDGVELIRYEDSRVTFDVDNDGYLENTGWVKGDDAILVHDANSNGIIDDITETISEYYGADPEEGHTFLDGLDALKSLDSNSDNIFDSNDAAYTVLRVWQDTNEDGRTDSGELKTLAELDITSIDLNREVVTRQNIEGNPILSRSTMVRDGIVHMVAAVDFTTNPVGYEWNEIDEGMQIISQDGEVASLRIIDDNGATINLATINNDLDPDNDASSVYGGAGDDIITGDDGDNWLAGFGGSDTLSGGDGNDVLVIDAEDDLENIDAGNGFDTIKIVGRASGVLNLTDLNAEVAVGGDNDDIIFGGGNTNVFMRGGAGNDSLIGGSADDVLAGEDGNDLLDGGYGNDILRGHRGRDVIIGNNGEDILFGGEDDDYLYGGNGEDLLRGDEGNDHLFGGDDYDVAEYRGNIDEYIVTVEGNGSIRIQDTVKGRDGTDLLTDIEAINFKNILEVDVQSISGRPFTSNDVISVSGSGPFTITAAGLLGNDIDYEGDVLHITGVSDAVGGTVTLLMNGDVSFTPDPDFQGVKSFLYTIADSNNNPGQIVGQLNLGIQGESKGIVQLAESSHPSDPLFYQQWYLTDTNVIPVWNDYTGKDVKIGVFELGLLDPYHSDLLNNVDQDTRDILDEFSRQFSVDSHATLVAGVIAATNNDVGSIGVAHDAIISGEQLSFNRFFFMAGIDFFLNYDVVNNSYGLQPDFYFSDNFYTNDEMGLIQTGGPEVSIEEAHDIPLGYLEYIEEREWGNKGSLQNSIFFGRDTLGTNIVWSAGNERAEGGSANASNLKNTELVITVGAINKQVDAGTLEVQSTPFSNHGSNILVSASGSNILSTSTLVENSNGSTFGSDYDNAQGTSFSAPIVSGIIALMLEANTDLGYRDIQEILAYSARIVDDTNTDWQTNGAKNWNGGGLHFSHDYGFGEVDALAAVRLAETWHKQETAHNLSRGTYDSGIINLEIDDEGVITDTIYIDDPLPLEHINVTLDFEHDQLGDLIVKLISPDGTESILLDRINKSPDDSNDLGFGEVDMKFSFGTRAHMGEIAEGTWTLSIEDAHGGAVGTLRSWSIEVTGGNIDHFEGTLPPSNSTFIYTNEYLLQTDPNRAVLFDNDLTSDYEDDTLNVSAITGNVTIDLESGATSYLDGKALEIDEDASIERLYAGDGDDSLSGNDYNNLIWAGRGDDTISGEDGDDWLIGKRGDNVLNGGNGADFFVIEKGDAGTHTIQDFDQIEGDKIFIGNYAEVDHINDMTITQVSADVQIILPDGEKIILLNTLVGNITNADFIFDSNFSHRLVRLEKYSGTSGNDNVWMGDTSKGYEIHGNDGNDTLFGGWGNDTIYGDDGNDILIGSHDSNIPLGGEDYLYGGAGSDTLYGSGQRDYLDGGAGSDVIFGNGGNDIIYLDGSYDQVTAGDGNETYIVRPLVSGTGVDLIHDFKPAKDKIDLTGFSDIHSFGDLDISLGQDTIGGIPVDVLYIGLQSGSINQKITLKGFDSLDDISGKNFYFSELENARPKSDNFTVYEDDSLAFTVTQILSNDSDANEGNVSFTRIINGPNHGTLFNNGGGNYTYTPNENYKGADRIIYEVADSNGKLATSAIDIKINSVNDAPTLNGNGNLVARTSTFFTHTINFTDKDDDALIYEATLLNDDPLPIWINFDPVTHTLYGTSPTEPEEVTIKISVDDGTSVNFYEVSLSVLTRTPDAKEDEFYDDEDQVITGNVLSNNGNGADLDQDSDLLSVQAGTIRSANGGVVVISSNGDFEYTPLANFNGTDSFQYTLLDDQGGRAAGRVSLTIDAVNDNPDAKDDELSGYEDAQITGNVLSDNGNGADSDIDGGSLFVVAETITTAEGGTVVIQSNGAFTYDHESGFIGDDSFVYILSDGQGGTSQGEVNLTINGTVSLITGTSGNDTLNGTSGNNTLYGLEGNDTINGLGGDDTIEGGAGNDTLNGGDGVDTLTYESAAGGVSVNLSTTSIQSTSGAGYDTVSNFENLIGSGSSDTLRGNDGTNMLNGGAGNDTIEGRGGNDTLDGGAGFDTLTYANAASAVTVDLSIATAQNTGGAGTDTATNFEYLTGSAYDDTLKGNSGNNTIKGESGNDNLYGGAGADTLTGGTGADIFLYDAASLGSSDTIADFNTGDNDKIDLTTVLSAYNPSTNDINDFVEITTSGSNSLLRVSISGNGTFQQIASLTGVTGLSVATLVASGHLIIPTTPPPGGPINGTSGNDTLNGTSGNETINGLEGNDTISGLGGDDLIEGGAGNDIMNGGDGIDTLTYENATGGVLVNLYTTSIQSTGGAGYDTISNFENLIGSGSADTLRGNDSDNTVYGGNGNDTIEGRGGNDTLDGGAGFDTLTYANAGSAVAVDLSITAAQNTGGAGTATATNFEYLTGSAYNDTLKGNSGNNNLKGEGGDDNLYAGSGADTLTGGAGLDNFIFDALSLGASDTIADFNTSDGDRIDLSDILQGYDPLTHAITDWVEITTSGSNSILKVDVNGGADNFVQIATITGVTGLTDEAALMMGRKLILSENYNISPIAKDDNLTFAHSQAATGNLLSNNGNGVDSDPNGDSISVVETSVTSAGGKTVSISSNGNFTYPTSIGWVGSDNFTYTLTDGTATDTATANITISAPSGATVGTSGNDSQTGNSSSNVIFGLEGNDTIFAGSGDDTLYGWDDEDRLNGERGSDIMIGGVGNDRLYDGYGSGAHWSVQDFMDGGAGDEYYYNWIQAGSIARSQIVISDSSGYDSLFYATDINNGYNFILSQATFTRYSDDGIRIEITESGTKKSDIIILDQLSDLGNTSGAGIEYIRLFTDGTYANTVNLKSYLSSYSGAMTTYGTDGDDIINGILIGNGNDTIYAGNGNDTLRGDAGTDAIYGDVGNDILIASDGTDTLYGGADSDVFLFEAINTNSDTIADFGLAQNDKIDISEILQGYDPLTDAITDFVQITTNGSDSILAIDVDGGANNFVQIATIAGVTGLTDETALIAGGSLISS